MIDTILVKRPQKAAGDANWDEGLNKYVEAGSKPTEIGSLAAYISSKGWTPTTQLVAGQQVTVTTYSISTMLDDDPLQVDDIIVITNCVRDVNLTGQELLVRAPIITSFATCHKVLADIWDGKRPR